MGSKANAIYEFLSGFGIPAYSSASVPVEAEYPYITYDLSVGSFMDGEVNITTNLWYRTDEEVDINNKVQEMSNAIGMGGCLVACDCGVVWIKRGTPWCQSVNTDSDDKIKHKYINIDVEYFTTD